MSGALDGLVVLDATRAFWASLGVALLGDFGADVIKLEPPDARRPGDDESASLFDLADRNKRSLAIDWAKAAGRSVFNELIAKADIFVTDAAFPVRAEQRLDYDDLARLKSGLIYVSASGFGAAGPDRDAPALDELAAARTGMMPILPQPGQPPVYAGAGQMYSAVMLALGALAALQHREETGEGQQVEVSLLAGNMYGASLDLQAYLAIGGERFLHPVSRLDAGNPMSGTLYPTSDGRWVTLTMPDTDRWWPGLAEVTGLDATDERFATHELRCEARRLELIELLDAAFRKHPADHWRAVFSERQMSADVIEDYSYPANDEQARASRYVIDDGNGRKMLGFPVFMSETPADLRRPASRPGEQSAEVLRDLLGYGDGDVKRLIAQGIVSAPGRAHAAAPRTEA
jgi:formyl-CoA transferase